VSEQDDIRDLKLAVRELEFTLYQLKEIVFNLVFIVINCTLILSGVFFLATSGNPPQNIGNLIMGFIVGIIGFFGVFHTLKSYAIIVNRSIQKYDDRLNPRL